MDAWLVGKIDRGLGALQARRGATLPAILRECVLAELAGALLLLATALVSGFVFGPFLYVGCLLLRRAGYREKWLTYSGDAERAFGPVLADKYRARAILFRAQAAPGRLVGLFSLGMLSTMTALYTYASGRLDPLLVMIVMAILAEIMRQYAECAMPCEPESETAPRHAVTR